MKLSCWWSYSRESASGVSLRNVLLRDCPGKWWFVTQGYVRGKSQSFVWNSKVLHSWGLNSTALLSFSATVSVWGLCRVIYSAFVKDSRGLQALFHYSGLSKVKCGCCQQHCFIWQWLICFWTCWQASCAVEPWTLSVATIVPAAPFFDGPNFNLTHDFSSPSGLQRAQDQTCSSVECAQEKQQCAFSFEYFLSCIFSSLLLDLAPLWYFTKLNGGMVVSSWVKTCQICRKVDNYLPPPPMSDNENCHWYILFTHSCCTIHGRTSYVLCDTVLYNMLK